MATPPNPDKKQCSAKNRAGQQCGRCAVPGRNVCSYHGGKTPVGTNAGSFKHGKYSSLLPVRWQQNFEAIIDDINLVSLRKDLAVTQMMVNDVMLSMDAGGMGEMYERLLDLVTAFEATPAGQYRDDGQLPGTGTGDINDNASHADAARILADIFREIRAGARENETIKTLMALQQHRRRLVQTEVTRITLTRQVVTEEQLNVLLSVILEAIKKHESDEETRAAIATEVFAQVHRVAPSHNVLLGSFARAAQS
jgi:hypothetical protein